MLSSPHQYILTIVQVQGALLKTAQDNLHPLHPSARGLALGVDIFMQIQERSNPYYLDTPRIVQETMDNLAKFAFFRFVVSSCFMNNNVMHCRVTGRSYHLFDYVGHPEATHVVVQMCSGAQTTEEVINHMNAQVCLLLCCYSFRPSLFIFLSLAACVS